MNWGKKLVFGMAVFIVFMVTLGAIMIMKNSTDGLVELDYYEKGQTYDEDFDNKQRALNDQIVPSISASAQAVVISFPAPVNYRVVCRRPSDYRMDRIFNGHTDKDRSIRFVAKDLAPGPWLLRIEYSTEENHYLFEHQIIVP